MEIPPFGKIKTGLINIKRVFLLFWSHNRISTAYKSNLP